jgi:hypothetical protein
MWLIRSKINWTSFFTKYFKSLILVVLTCSEIYPRCPHSFFLLCKCHTKWKIFTKTWHTFLLYQVFPINLVYLNSFPICFFVIYTRISASLVHALKFYEFTPFLKWTLYTSRRTSDAAHYFRKPWLTSKILIGFVVHFRT